MAGRSGEQIAKVNIHWTREGRRESQGWLSTRPPPSSTTPLLSSTSPLPPPPPPHPNRPYLLAFGLFSLPLGDLRPRPFSILKPHPLDHLNPRRSSSSSSATAVTSPSTTTITKSLKMRLIIPRIGSELMTKFRGKKPTKQKNKRTNNKSNTINKFQSSGWKPPTLTTWRCWCDVTIVRTNQRQSTSATLLPSFENQNSNFKQTKWNNEIIEIDVMKSNQWQNQWNHRLKVVEYPRPPIGLWRHPLLLPLPHPFLNFLNFWPCLALPPLPWGCLRFPKATTPPPP